MKEICGRFTDRDYPSRSSTVKRVSPLSGTAYSARKIKDIFTGE
jgi:hypothetical protein